MPYRRRKRKKSEKVEFKPELAKPALVAIPTGDVADVWPVADAFIEEAAQEGEYSADELRAECEAGAAQLWLAWSDHCEAAMVTRVLADDICLIAALGGKDMTRWLHLLGDVEQWARAEGCKGMRAYARKGWGQKLKDYTVTRVILDKRLT